MLVVLNFLFLTGLLVLVYQDFKDREVTFLVFPFLLIVGAVLHYRTQYIEIFLLNLIINLGLLSVVLLMLLLYVRLVIKKKFNQAIGSGDVLFFIVIAISFPSITFSVLFSASLFFSLIIYQLLKPKIGKNIPLAGLQSLFLFFIIVSNSIFNFVNLYTI